MKRSRRLLLVLGLILLALGGTWAAAHQYVRHQARLAEQAAADYDFETAERCLSACLKVYPRDAQLHFQMARVARRANHYEQAEQHLRECQRLGGKNPENALEAILLQAQVGDIARVEKLLLGQVADASPDSNLILEALAQGYTRIYHLDAAMGCLNQLVQREPDNLSARLLRASLWKTAGNYDGALEDCRRAVEAHPEHRAARRRLAESFLMTRQPEEALAQLEYLQQGADGNAADLRVDVARCHRQLGHMQTARRILDDLLAADPHDGAALLERGRVALESESPAAAEEWFRQVVAAYPHDAQANYLLAQALQKQGREDEARVYEAVRAQSEGDRKALDEAFRKVLKNPVDPEPRRQAARICLRNGRNDEAERWLLSALQQAPRDLPTREDLAALYERTGRTELAAQYRRSQDAP